MCNFNVFVSISRYIAEGWGAGTARTRERPLDQKTEFESNAKEPMTTSTLARSLTHSPFYHDPLLGSACSQPSMGGGGRRRAIKIKIRWLPELPSKRTRVLWAAVASAACLLLPGWGCWGRGAYVVLYKGFNRRSFIQPLPALGEWRQ